MADVQQRDKTGVVSAKRTARGGIQLQFADGFAKTMPLKKLGLTAEGVLWATLRALGDGSGIRMTATFGPPVILDGATLRYLADADYAVSVDAAGEQMSIPNEKIERLAAKHTLPRRPAAKSREATRERATRK